MESFIEYFSRIPSSHRSLLLIGGIVFFWMLEGVVPLFRFRYNKWRHAGLNVVFTLTTILVNFAMAFLLVGASDWAVTRGIGVLQWLDLPLWADILVGLMLMDLVGAWLAHFTEHKVVWMWKFHLVHHTDTFVDTTTANRHHPGESVIRFVFTLAAVVITGAPLWVIFLYQSLSVLLSQFNHANITLPPFWDRLIGAVIVTPDMHHVHHHHVQPYTDTNYGNIFSLWDRIFGTYAKLDAGSLVYGIDTHPAAEENAALGNLVKIPFQKYRPPAGAKFAGPAAKPGPAETGR